MSIALSFSSRCPACTARSLRHVRLLGLPLRCRHCGAQFQAADADAESAAVGDPVGVWLRCRAGGTGSETLSDLQVHQLPR